MDIVLETYRIFMTGTVSDIREAILNENFCTFGLNNGVDNYLHHEEVEQALTNFLKNHNETNTKNSVEAACKLF